MGAKETILSYLKVSNQIPMTLLEFIAKLEEQVKTTWPIAYKAGHREAQDGIWDKVMGAKKSGFDEGKQEGIREVVEWVSRYSKINKNQYDEYWGYMVLKLEEWQAKLKEWGIQE